MDNLSRAEKYTLLVHDLAALPKKEAVSILLECFPHITKSFFERNLTHLMSLDPVGLYSTLTYADPTADKAARRADAHPTHPAALAA